MRLGFFAAATSSLRSGFGLGFSVLTGLSAWVFSLSAPSPEEMTASTSSAMRVLKGAASRCLGANPRSFSIWRLAIFMVRSWMLDRKKWRRLATARSMDAVSMSVMICVGVSMGPDVRVSSV